jgi:hypothetical protein
MIAPKMVLMAVKKTGAVPNFCLLMCSLASKVKVQHGGYWEKHGLHIAIDFSP